jgi:hypothetical protein
MAGESTAQVPTTYFFPAIPSKTQWLKTTSFINLIIL